MAKVQHDDWPEVIVRCPAIQADQYESWLFAAGALSVTLSNSADHDDLALAVLEPAPGEIRLWNHVALVGLFAQGTESDQVHQALLLAADEAGLTLPEYTLSPLQEQTWERAWMIYFKPMCFGQHLWIYPTETEVPQISGATVLRLDPGLAFGTGTHPTTAQCLHWLGEQNTNASRSLEGMQVVDYGCGSGVLAIAALLLGASRAWAVDIDEQALLATRSNAQINQVSDQLVTDFPEGLPKHIDQQQVDLVMANILFQPLMELAETMCQAVTPGGRMIMSGILESQVSDIHERYRPFFRVDQTRVVDGWALIAATRLGVRG